MIGAACDIVGGLNAEAYHVMEGRWHELKPILVVHIYTFSQNNPDNACLLHEK